MANRKRKGKRKTRSRGLRSKRVPCQRVLRYLLQHTGNGEDSHYIDLARDLSLLNRRLYRQGKVYGIAGITVHDNVIQGTGDTFVKACTARTLGGGEAWKRVNDAGMK